MQSLPARDGDGAPDEAGVAAAVAALRQGELVIVPTDTVYGIAADSANADAVARLFVAKQRPADKAIPLLAASAEQAAMVADLNSPLVQRLIARWWPGPLTIVARALVSLPEGVGTRGTVGIRVPADPVVAAIARALGRPLATTSANRSGDAAVATFEEAVRDLRPWVAVALDGGPCYVGVASTVVDCTGEQPVVLRQGSADVSTVSGPVIR